MKTSKLIALCCAILLIASGCAVSPIPTPPTDADAVVVDTVKYQEVYSNYVLYQQLSDTEKTYYGMIYTAVRDHLSTETTIQDAQGQTINGIRISLTNARLSAEETSRLFESFYLDNPEFFYIDRTYSLSGRQINNHNVYDTLILQYTMDAEQRISATQQLNTAVQNILNQRPSDADDYLTELYLHDSLLETCVYDQAATESSSKHPNAYSAHGALVEGKAVCEGYAKAMQILLNAVSIPTTVVRGFSTENQTAHMWNLVEINGKHYYLDPTWNDSEPHHHYSYFNITTDALKRTHVIDAATPLTMECTATTDNYFVRNGTYITDYDRDQIADAIAKQIQQGGDAVHLQFADGKYENGLLLLKNSTLTKKMVDAHLPDGMNMWNYELRIRADQNTISIHKS